MAPAPNAPLPPWAMKLIRLIAKLIAGNAHAQVTVTIRDGKVQFVGVNQTFKVDNLPDT